MNSGFVKASSDNLPIVDFEMVLEFTSGNADYISTEVKHVKTSRATRHSYGDNAVGYVQLKREGGICTVHGKITPEHKIRNKNYNVSVIIEENEKIIKECKCIDCAASQGGCRHAIAFLFWLHRRSEEPSVTSTECYWKKSVLSDVIKDKQFLSLKDLVDKDIPSLRAPNGMFLEKVKKISSDGGIFDFFSAKRFKCLLIHQLPVDYRFSVNVKTPEAFIQHLTTQMSHHECKEAEQATRDQSKNPLWYDLRYGRITASRLYEVSRCQTPDGTLIDSILGATKPFETQATERGKYLERKVLDSVAALRSITVEQCGMFLNKEFPIFGASPDGISENYVIEVKCPFKESTVKNYVEKGVIKKRYYFQVQLQMFLAQRKKALFCVASPNFEISNEVNIYEIDFDENGCVSKMESAREFWIRIVFSKIIS